jgi:hypothetical protein
MYFPVSGWVAAFAITLAVEIPVAIYLLRRSQPDLVRLGLLIVLANLATHPIVWYVIGQVLMVGTAGYTLVAEAWAIGVEAVFYAVTIPNVSARRALAVAVAANTASFIAGRVVGAVRPDLFG